MATTHKKGGQAVDSAAPTSALSNVGSIFFSASDSRSDSIAAPAAAESKPVTSHTMLLFQEPDTSRAVEARRARRTSSATATDEEELSQTPESPKRSRRGSRGGRKSSDVQDEARDDSQHTESESTDISASDDNDVQAEATAKRSRTRMRLRKNADNSAQADDSAADTQISKKAKKAANAVEAPSDDAVDAAVTVRKRRRRISASEESVSDQVSAPKGSTRLEAKRQRRKEGREAGRKRHTITESEFLARREAVDRTMLVRERDGLNQIAVIEDGVLVEHYVARHTQSSMVGNVYLGRVQNVLPSMEAAFVDIGKGRNAVLYAGEVNWDAAGLEGKPRRIEEALKSGDTVLVQVTKDPIGHKGARLTSQVTLAGRHLVLVPNGGMTGISRKLPEKERARLKKILKDAVPSEYGVIVRTAAEGASEEQLKNDVERLTKAWADIEAKSKSAKNAPSLLKGEPELAVRVVRDVFNEDFNSLQVQGEQTWETISEYVQELSPDLVTRVTKWEDSQDIFQINRVDEQLAKAFDRKVFLPSGGSLVIDRTEAMTVIDVNTGKFTGAAGGSLEETVTKNNLEAAEEIVRQLRLRDIGGIVVIDFIDMVLEANRDLVLRRLIECLGRDRTRHQVAEVTSLGLVQMTRKRVGQGLVEAFSTTCEHCEGRGYITYDHPIEKGETPDVETMVVGAAAPARAEKEPDPAAEARHAEVRAALNNIAAAAAHKHQEQDTQISDEIDDKTDSKGARRPSKKRSLKTRSASRSSDQKAASKEEGQDDSHPQGTDGVDADKDKTLHTPTKGSRIVTSSGTITPGGSGAATSAILSFPVRKADS